ncbi:MAG: hypothetical protein IKO90_09415 [Bacteroidales bacterium]|nr:hypothetical protein [Bacteroidales bacterium]
MNRIIYLGCVITLLAGVVGCEKDPKVDATSISIKSVSAVTGSTAVVSAEIGKGMATIAERGICWSNGENPSITDAVVYAAEGGAGVFQCQLNNLDENKTYNVRAFAKNGSGVMYSENFSFKTSKKLVVKTLELKDKLGTCAEAAGAVEADGDTTIVQKGFCWSVNPNPTINDSIVFMDNSSKESQYVLWMRNLTPSTTYYYKAFVTNAAGTAYGEEKAFTTLDNPVVKKTDLGAVEVENGKYFVVCAGTITDTLGNVPVTQCGFCWSKNPNPTVDNEKIDKVIANTVEIGTFKDTVWVEIEENVTYYVRAYVITENGVAYGEQSSFLMWSLPIVSIFNAYSITSNSATEGGVIVSDGSAPIQSRGFCWTIDENTLPTVEDNQSVTVSSSNSIYYGNLTNLTPNTTYYVRAYVTNKIGTSYSDVVSFTTKAK